MFKLARHWFVGKAARKLGESELIETKKYSGEHPPSEWLEKINSSDELEWVISGKGGSAFLKEFSKPAGLAKKVRETMSPFEINAPMVAGEESVTDEFDSLVNYPSKRGTKVSNEIKVESGGRSVLENDRVRFIPQKKRDVHHEHSQVPFKRFRKIKLPQSQLNDEGSWKNQKDSLNSKESAEIINPDVSPRQSGFRKKSRSDNTYSMSKKYRTQEKNNTQKLAYSELKSLLREPYIESNQEGLSKGGSPKTKVEKAAPSFERSSLFRFVPEDNGAWPALPLRNKASNENNNGVTILREQNRLQLLEKEQRIMPWIV